MKEIKDLLKEYDFFKGLSPNHLELIAGCGANVHFKKGKYIFKQEEASNYFFVIRQGHVALEIDGVEKGILVIQTLDPGEVIGWSWLIPPHKYSFSARALEETSLIALDGKCLRQKCEKDNHLGYELLKKFSKVLAKRLELSRLQLLDVYGK